MNSDGDVEGRLLHAKKLLKKFQTKNGAMDNRLENGFDGVNGIGNDGSTLGVATVDQTSRGVASTASGNSSRPSSALMEKVSGNSFQSSLNSQTHSNANIEDADRLRNLLNEKERTLNETLGKLQQLHTHYAELYSAYNLLSQSQNSNAPSADFALQISQLQTALAVAIEEKTNLQSEMRNLKGRLEVVESEYKAFQESHKSTSFSSSKIQSELAELKFERNQLFETISNQSQQIETHRMECSNLEAKIILIHQDRNETQARLKYLYEEKLNLEKDLEKLRNDLNLKDIYIRQLTRFSQNDPAQDQLVIQALTDEKKRCEEETQLKQLEIVELKKQFESSREHYELCLADLRQQIAVLETEANDLRESKAQLSSVRSYQEEQLRMVNSELERLTHAKASDDLTAERTAVNMDDYLSLQNSYASLQEDFQRCQLRVQDLEGTVAQDDSQLEALQYELIDSRRKIADLEESNRLQASLNLDVNTLSDQLQNEKATVSRAVEQNLQLKQQLEELQNKIIDVTNDSATKEDERLSAIATVKYLRLQLEEISRTRTRSSTSDSSSVNANSEHHDCHSFAPVKIAEEVGVNGDGILENGRLSKSPTHLGDSEIMGNTTVNVPEDASTECKDLNRNDGVQPAFSATTNTANGNCADNELKSRAESPKNLVKSNGHTIDVLNECENTSDMKNRELISELERRLAKALSDGAELRTANERLEYLLTALEMENESIGEYVALYRFQRANLQLKLRESARSSPHDDTAALTARDSVHKCAALANSENGNDLNSVGTSAEMKCSGCVECRGELVNL